MRDYSRTGTTGTFQEVRKKMHLKRNRIGLKDVVESVSTWNFQCLLTCGHLVSLSKFQTEASAPGSHLLY